MKTLAAWYRRNGDAREVLEVGELDVPPPGVGEVCVRLTTSGVNPSDVKSRRTRPVDAPLIVPHSDGAGVISAVGSGVDVARVGERVWIWNGQWQRPLGTASQYIVLPAEQAVALPEGTTDAEAACLGIPALTAQQAINLAGDLAGRTVLVIGAGAAVGHYVTQLAKLAGARVIGTVGSEARAVHARAAGADELVNYKTESVVERVKTLTAGQGVDAIIDMDFSTTSGWLPQGVLRRHGVLVCYGSNVSTEVPVTFRPLLWGSFDLRFFLVYDLTPADRARTLGQLTTLMRAGRLKHAVAQHFPLADIALAHEAVEAGQAVGNIVIDLP
jgi:NADPH2:quinone reductase